MSALKEIHDDIDRATFDAYGWSDLIPELVGKPGAIIPTRHKSPEQEEAEEELVARLVALNSERVEEERRGDVRWLRPDYQIPKLDRKLKELDDVDQFKADFGVTEPAEGKPTWPRGDLDRIRIVRDMLGGARGPMGAENLSGAFRGRNSVARRKGVTRVLETLAAAGVAQKSNAPDGNDRFFVPR